MLVEDLIKLLETLPKDYEVLTYGECNSKEYPLTVKDIDVDSKRKKVII